ncbi:hypothetical protein FNF27_00804 [Cafeteria roenbergensis]|uniref:J domain-containing protein n=1 Tax=Cafeteria roenbergensis TaxID=33653 RepID=A0A5A8EPK8_CAFRO|nr:hypothetical protein FNF28_03786 [Cafeteria roenbergensis]KAA0177631.1 hypothetical protein FNF27_00804 [Cafeteria roenbergensis]
MGLVSDAFHLGAYTDEANSGSPVAPREGLDGAAPVPTRPPWRSARSPAKLLGSFFLSAVAARLGRDLQLNFDNSSVVHSSFEWRWDFQQASSTSSWMSRWHNAAHYRVLGLQPGATQSEIRTAFLKRSIETHPDKNPGQQAAFVKVRDAYDALKA